MNKEKRFTVERSADGDYFIMDGEVIDENWEKDKERAEKLCGLYNQQVEHRVGALNPWEAKIAIAQADMNKAIKGYAAAMLTAGGIEWQIEQLVK